MADLTFLPSDISISQAIDIVIQQPRINDSNLTKKQIKETLESFHGDILASIVFLEKYALTDSNNKFYEWTLEQAKKRWAKAIHNIEKKYKNPIREKDFLKLYDYFLPAGRQMLGLGNNFIEKLTVNNCYFTAIKDDSLESIFDAAYKIAKTFSYSGGQGIDLGVLRPKEALVSNTAKTSTGAVSFAPMYSYITGLIGQRGRRGALLLSMPINHPDIEDFIDMKTKNIDDVRYANISVKITDEFMNAVENNQDFELSFKTKHEIIRKKINARKLFDKIVKAACNSGEPGILFWDACIRGSTSEIYDDLHVGGCNPCVTGDTLIYVADGRGHVSIKQLAEENKDIPVFCFDRKNKVKIRYMRNPRITGYNKPIWKITLDNNFEIRTTANHKFQLSNGEYKEVSELKKGDSLKRITKFAAENFNHKIIKIEFDGYENVYNGTVDEFHNYFIGGCEEKTKNGKNKWSYFNCLNCGEQILPSFSNCNLGSLLLHRFVKRPFTDKATFDFSLFNQMIALAVRHLDNVVDYNDGKNPLPEQNKNAIQERRIGLGVTGLADCLAALNLRYDSDEAISFINSLFNIKRLTEYNTSMLLASERGSFPAFKYPEHVQQRSLAWMSDGMKANIGKHGLRNIAISTIAPSGSLSVIANNCSSGIEPVYSHSYKRTVNLGTGKREFEVVHPGIIIAKKINKNFDIKKYYPTAYDIDWEKRVQIQGVIQLKIDSAISSCLSLNDNFLITDNGLLSMKEIIKDTPIKEFQKIDSKIKSINSAGNFSDVTESYNNGISNIVKITCERGFNISGTYNHKVEVLNNFGDREWKELKDIKIGDYIVGRGGLELWRKDIENNTLSTINGSRFNYKKLTNSKKIKIPKRMSIDFARWLGYMMSDGSINVNGISLSQQKNNIHEDFQYLVKKLFNLSCSVQKDDRANNLYSVVVNSRELVAFCKWIGLTSHDNNTVPLVIRKSGSECIKEFIKGVTLDGYISKDKICVATSVSKIFLDQLLIMLENLGINGCLIESSQEGERIFPSGKIYKTKKSWDLLCCGPEASKFIKRIGFAEDRKKEEIEKFELNKRYYNYLFGQIPDFDFRKKFNKEILPNIKSKRMYDICHSLCCGVGKHKTIERETLLLFNDLGLQIPDFFLDKTYIFKKVTKITLSKTQEITGDVSVPEGNSYLVNGMISHNTINLPVGTKEETVAEIYMAAWKNNLKGITVYVDQSREGVLNINKQKPLIEAPLDTKCFSFCAEGGDKFYVHVSYKESKPYQIFATNYKATEHDRFAKLANDIKLLLLEKGIPAELLKGKENTEKKIDKQCSRSKNSLDKITRLISLALKANYIDNLLGVLENHAIVGTLAFYLYHILLQNATLYKKSCKNCGSTNLKYENGCSTCIECGNSSCG